MAPWTPTTPTATTELTEADLLRIAGATSFGRGEDYVRYVHGLRMTEGGAQASIQARNVYLVELDWSGRDIGGSCTCPYFARGNFCKHLVALGLAAIDAVPGRVGSDAGSPSPTALTEYVERLDLAALRGLVHELVQREPGVERLLEVRAASSSGATGAITAELTGMVTDALRSRGFVDYRRSFDVARDAQDVLDELEAHLDEGIADGVRPALFRALTRLRKITEQSDDSSGMIGDACQRAADLHARSCREGSPDRVKLARWLVKFRDESPGWPETTLADYASAFDDKALAAYRKGVAALERKHAGTDRWERFEVDRMLLELADHDGDIDRAVELLSDDDVPQYAAIVERLRTAGRDDDAFGWMERGVAAGHARAQAGGSGYRLDPTEVAQEYLARGRTDDAVGLYRTELARRPGVASFGALLDFADQVDRRTDEREWALAKLRELATAPYGSGAALVQIALSEHDLEAAWSVAEELGAGHAWESLALALAADFPGRAAELHQPRVDEALTVTDSSRYPGIAQKLATMKSLCERSGEADDFAAYVEGIRTRYGRRPSLMKALDRAGL